MRPIVEKIKELLEKDFHGWKYEYLFDVWSLIHQETKINLDVHRFYYLGNLIDDTSITISFSVSRISLTEDEKKIILPLCVKIREWNENYKKGLEEQELITKQNDLDTYLEKLK